MQQRVQRRAAHRWHPVMSPVPVVRKRVVSMPIPLRSVSRRDNAEISAARDLADRLRRQGPGGLTHDRRGSSTPHRPIERRPASRPD